MFIACVDLMLVSSFTFMFIFPQTSTLKRGILWSSSGAIVSSSAIPNVPLFRLSVGALRETAINKACDDRKADW